MMNCSADSFAKIDFVASVILLILLVLSVLIHRAANSLPSRKFLHAYDKDASSLCIDKRLSIFLGYESIYHSRVAFWLAIQSILLVYALQDSTTMPLFLSAIGILISILHLHGTRTLYERIDSYRIGLIASSPEYDLWYQGASSDGGGTVTKYIPLLFGIIWALVYIGYLISLLD